MGQVDQTAFIEAQVLLREALVDLATFVQSKQQGGQVPALVSQAFDRCKRAQEKLNGVFK